MRIKILSLLTLAYFSNFASAQMECDIGGVARCICPASMMVQCENGTYNGNIKDDVKPLAIRVSVLNPDTGQNESVWLENPPGEVRQYYGNTANNPWVLRQLGDRGILVRSNTQINLTSARVGNDVTLYQDFNAQTPVNRESEVAQGIQCGYSQNPGIASASACGSQKLCFGTASCYENGQVLGHFFNLSCSALPDGECPSATKCANDTSVQVGLSNQVEYERDLSRDKVRVTQ